jgi:hypothetical protein
MNWAELRLRILLDETRGRETAGTETPVVGIIEPQTYSQQHIRLYKTVKFLQWILSLIH